LVAAARIMQSSTSPTRLVVSDQPIVTVLAHRQMPGELVDLASLRFETGSLDQRDVLRTIDVRCVAAVLVGRALRDEPIVLAGLVRRFARRERIEAGTLYLDLKAQCRAPVPAP